MQRTAFSASRPSLSFIFVQFRTVQLHSSAPVNLPAWQPASSLLLLILVTVRKVLSSQWNCAPCLLLQLLLSLLLLLLLPLLKQLQCCSLAYIILHFIVVHEICVNSASSPARVAPYAAQLGRLIRQRQQQRQRQQHPPSGLKYLWLAILCTIIYAFVCL